MNLFTWKMFLPINTQNIQARKQIIKKRIEKNKMIANKGMPCNQGILTAHILKCYNIPDSLPKAKPYPKSKVSLVWERRRKMQWQVVCDGGSVHRHTHTPLYRI